MRFSRCVQAAFGILLAGGSLAASCWVTPLRADESGVLKPVDQRFQDGTTDEVPDFQRHVVPLFGRLGCNGRACHGSFQGKGGFQLSLFGYDFKSDHAALVDEDNPRVDVDDPDFSLIIAKPTNADDHEGGQRYEKGSWQFHVLHRWIDSGAGYHVEAKRQLVSLDVEPAEIVFHEAGENIQLRAVVVWSDGAREDVTPLCRFRTNNGEIATVDETGVVTSGEQGDTHVVAFYDNGVTPIPVARPVSASMGERYPDVPTPTRIDELTTAKLRKLGIIPSSLSSDPEFLRRVSLDLTGTLPTPDEVVAFVADRSEDKRARKIDQLLDTPAYAAWWTTRLCDFTGNNDAQLNNALPTRNRMPSADWYQWIYQRVADNVPYDELVAGIVMGKSRASGESYAEYCQMMSDLCRKGSDASFAVRETMPYYWARRDFREPAARAIGFAYSFLGVRIQCAQCHKHPFDQWTKDDFAQFQAFFGGVVASNRPRREDQAEYNRMLKELGLKDLRGGQLRGAFQKLLDEGKTVPFPEIYVVNAPTRNRNARQRANVSGPARTATLPGGQVVDLSQYKDPREALMEWMRGDSNPYFSQAFVNRVWANYFNVGIVSPPDDMSLANPPSNQALLEYLAQGFRDSGFDMKWLHREIANSRTYQLSWRPNDTNRLDERNFSHAIPRRLPAEVIYDAARQATGSDQRMEQARTQLAGRAIAVPGTTSRGSRDGDPRFALSVFGRSVRESNCDCDRSEEPNLLQTVYLQNDRDIQNMLNRRDGWLAEAAGGAIGAVGGQARRPDNYAETVRNAERRIRRLRQAGDTQQANQLQKRLTQMKRRFEAGGSQATDRSTADSGKLDVDQMIRSAYLRTLSREPNDEETQIAQQYIQNAGNQVSGLRDVLWALINTKEFIVNH